MRIPSKLVQLGEALELDTTQWEWTWLIKDGMQLWSNPEGNTLVLLSKNKTKNRTSWLTNGKEPDIKQAQKLYSRFQDFDSETKRAINLTKEPKLERRGVANFICYQSNKWDEKNQGWQHDFNNRPAVWSDNPKRPYVIIIHGKKVRVTARGIEG